MPCLLSPRQLISSLIPSIPSSTHLSTPNPLKDTPPATQKALLTLHVLFPNELLPALDLLDRNLITRLTVTSKHGHVQAQQRQPPDHPPQDDLQLQPDRHLQGDHQQPSLGPPRRGSGSHATVLPEGLAVRSDRLQRIQQERASHSTSRPPPEVAGQVSEDASDRALHSELDSPSRAGSPHSPSRDRNPHRPEVGPHPHPHPPPPGRGDTHLPSSRRQDLDPALPPPQHPHLPRRRPTHHPSDRREVESLDSVHAVWRCRSARGVQEDRDAKLRREVSRVSGSKVEVVNEEERQWGSGYEVRLEAWSCSCPAFAFKIVNATARDGDVNEHGNAVVQRSTGMEYLGGMGIGNEVPICKHLLACALVEYCGVFNGMVDEEVISIEELAGLAAGWAD